MKAQDETSGNNLNETEICNFPGEEFRVMFIKTLIGLGGKMEEDRENFNKEIETYKKVPNRSLRAEEHNNRTERYVRGVQQQTR